MKWILLCGITLLFTGWTRGQCENPTATTASGTKAPQGFCSGDLIFEDNFDSFDLSTWSHDLTMAGGGNDEFQWYVNSRFNSFTEDGNLHLKPTYTSDIYGEDFLTSGRIVIPPDQCTNDWNYGCDRQGSPDNIVSPIRSALVKSYSAFAFKYGTIEFRAKLPAGDWIWPALWMMPERSVYGGWPRSGEIDVLEIRSNRQLFNGDVNVGAEQAGSTMHFGPQWNINGWSTTHWTKNKQPGFDADFHRYKLVWTPTQMQYFIDDEIIGTVNAGNGFWERGGFEATGEENPWSEASIMAPFDQEFYIIMNVAVGGNYFSDSFRNEPYPKPW
jgi:beta-glucanase (GH16 family)